MRVCVRVRASAIACARTVAIDRASDQASEIGIARARAIALPRTRTMELTRGVMPTRGQHY